MAAGENAKGRWKCRRCHGLRYQTTLDDETSKSITAAWKAARPLGLEHLVHPKYAGPKASGMHRKTFERHKERYEEAYERVDGGIDAFVSGSRERLCQFSRRIDARNGR